MSYTEMFASSRTTETVASQHSECWLTEQASDGELSLSRFGIPFSLDQKAEVTEKSCGGGMCNAVAL